jgi:septal ring factor EnvC (AmiA/AmiB activator)
LSTLTKVLIVLVTLFSIFLCGIVTMYVASADNFRAEADRLRRDEQTAREARRGALAELEQGKQTFETLKADLDKQINALTIARTDLQTQLDTIKRENSQLVQKLADMAAVVETANGTMAKLRDQAAAAEEEVKVLRADQTNRNKELQETTRALMERMAVIADMEKKNRQLIEEKQGLETQLSQVLQQYGKAPVRPPIVTAQQTTAQPIQRTPVQPVQAAPSPTKDIGLNARVTQVDMKNRLASISIGAAAGVREQMKFHVTRGDRFICDIVIFDVDPEKAIGFLDLVQTEPQVGDLVTTNL